MPRNVRNFWLELEVDGKKTRIATGPRSATGGFDLTIRVREDGDVSAQKVRLEGVVTTGGRLVLRAYFNDRWQTLLETPR